MMALTAWLCHCNFPARIQPCRSALDLADWLTSAVATLRHVSSAGCNSPGTACIHHPKDAPLLFDLTTDESESKALDISKPPYAAVAATMVSMRDKEIADVATTAHTVTNYSSSAAGRKENCCNEAVSAAVFSSICWG